MTCGDTLGYARVSTADQSLSAQRNRRLERQDSSVLAGQRLADSPPRFAKEPLRPHRNSGYPPSDDPFFVAGSENPGGIGLPSDYNFV